MNELLRQGGNTDDLLRPRVLMADRILVMSQGRIVGELPTEAIRKGLWITPPLGGAESKPYNNHF